MVQICSHMVCYFISVSLLSKSLFHLFIALYGHVIFFVHEFNINNFVVLLLIDFVIDIKFWLFLNVFAVLESINLLHFSGSANIIYQNEFHPIAEQFLLN